MYRRAIFSCFSPSSAVPTILIRYISSSSHIVLSVQNKDLKHEIDMLRREIIYKNYESKRLHNLTKKMHKKATKENKEATSNRTYAEQ